MIKETKLEAMNGVSRELGVNITDRNGQWYVAPACVIFERVDLPLDGTREQDFDAVARARDALFARLRALLDEHGDQARRDAIEQAAVSLKAALLEPGAAQLGGSAMRALIALDVALRSSVACHGKASAGREPKVGDRVRVVDPGTTWSASLSVGDCGVVRYIDPDEKARLPFQIIRDDGQWGWCHRAEVVAPGTSESRRWVHE